MLRLWRTENRRSASSRTSWMTRTMMTSPPKFTRRLDFLPYRAVLWVLSLGWYAECFLTLVWECHGSCAGSLVKCSRESTDIHSNCYEMLWVIRAGYIFCSPNQQQQCLSLQFFLSRYPEALLATSLWQNSHGSFLVSWWLRFWFSNQSRFCTWNPGVGILTCFLRHVRPRSMAMSCESSFPSLRRRAGSMPCQRSV